MWGPPEFLRSVAVVIVVAAIGFAVSHSGSRFATPVVEVRPLPASPASDDLSTELRRCRALGPQDAVDARCVAVWEENRRRFFGAPARPLPSGQSANAAGSVLSGPSTSIPATPTPAHSMPGVAR